MTDTKWVDICASVANTFGTIYSMVYGSKFYVKAVYTENNIEKNVYGVSVILDASQLDKPPFVVAGLLGKFERSVERVAEEKKFEQTRSCTMRNSEAFELDDAELQRDESQSSAGKKVALCIFALRHKLWEQHELREKRRVEARMAWEQQRRDPSISAYLTKYVDTEELRKVVQVVYDVFRKQHATWNVLGTTIKATCLLLVIRDAYGPRSQLLRATPSQIAVVCAKIFATRLRPCKRNVEICCLQRVQEGDDLNSLTELTMYLSKEFDKKRPDINGLGVAEALNEIAQESNKLLTDICAVNENWDHTQTVSEAETLLIDMRTLARMCEDRRLLVRRKTLLKTSNAWFEHVKNVALSKFEKQKMKGGSIVHHAHVPGRIDCSSTVTQDSFSYEAHFQVDTDPTNTQSRNDQFKYLTNEVQEVLLERIVGVTDLLTLPWERKPEVDSQASYASNPLTSHLFLTDAQWCKYVADVPGLLCSSPPIRLRITVEESDRVLYRLFGAANTDDGLAALLSLLADGNRAMQQDATYQRERQQLAPASDRIERIAREIADVKFRELYPESYVDLIDKLIARLAARVDELKQNEPDMAVETQAPQQQTKKRRAEVRPKSRKQRVITDGWDEPVGNYWDLPKDAQNHRANEIVAHNASNSPVLSPLEKRRR